MTTDTLTTTGEPEGTRAPAVPAPPLDAPAPPGDPLRPPVFVDSTGRRARLGRRVGLVLAGLLVSFLGSIGIIVATGASVPLTPWSGHGPRHTAKPEPPPSLKSIHRGPDGRVISGPGAPVTPPAARRSGPPAPAPTDTERGRTTPAPVDASATPTPTPTPSATTPTAVPTPTPSATRPGHGRATPPGRAKKNR
ncbi:hypothetical protein [Actinomadura macrotermitis]|nr:hypothetical protein [Actinomadura macrotermitis]